MDTVGLGLRVLLLLAAANITPIGAKILLGDRWNAPLDGGLRLADGQRLLGPSKTVRGLVTAVIGATLMGALLRFPLILGAEVGALAILGDAIASFVKRRLRLAPSSRATGLDQIPEALLPLVVLRDGLGLSWLEVGAVTFAFFALEIPLAWLSFRLRLRDRPF
jgi:CDP-2,3-bis-(O-geranylgeranyl)-sn-glycerol synthase